MNVSTTTLPAQVGEPEGLAVLAGHREVGDRLARLQALRARAGAAGVPPERSSISGGGEAGLVTAVDELGSP